MNFNVSAWAIRKPLPSLLLFFILTVTGLYSFAHLPITYFPTVITPLVKVTVEQSGATPSEMETEITRRIEDSVASLNAIKSIKSTIGQGISVTDVEFELGQVTPDRAMSDVRDAVAKIRADLPSTADEPIIERVEEESRSVVTYAVSAPDMTVAELSWYVDDVVARELQGLPGVGTIERIGGGEREIRVELDPVRLQALSLSVNAINENLAQSQIDNSGGRSAVSAIEHALTIAGAAKSVEDLASHSIALSSDMVIRLKDLGTVEDTMQEPRSYATLDGADVVGFTVYPSQGASDISVSHEVAKALSQLGAQNPDMRFHIVDDNFTYTAGNYHSAMSTLIEGAILSVIIVFLFLRDWRATVIAAITLPLSIIPTFFVIDLLGFSLNILSLLAITLVTGILVDDAIVEIENVVRHRNMGKSAYRAALDASDEIGLAVIAISATIIAVFVPVGFMPGEVGLYFREFGLTVAISVFFSLLVARLITPVFAAWFMTGSPQPHDKKGRVVSAYLRLLQKSLRWRWLTIGLAAASFVLSLQTLISLPTAFLPEEDIGRLTLSVELPAGSTLDETRSVTDEIAQRIREVPFVEGVFTRAGASGSGLEDVNHATILIDLVHKSQRDISSFAIEEKLEKDLAYLPDVKLRFLNARGGRDLSFAVLGADSDAVEKAANAIVAELGADPSFINPGFDNAAMRPEMRMQVEMDKAAMLGIPTSAIAQMIRVSTIGDSDSRLPDFIDGSRQIPVRLVIEPASRDDLHRLGMLAVPAADGTHVPLTSVVDISFGETVSSIERLDRERRIEVGADLANGLTSGQGMQRLMQLQAVKKLPDGVRIQATGDSDTEGEVFDSFAIAMGSGIMLVLVVLILLFGNLFAPWTILASLPLSIGGVVAGLWLSGSAISLPVVIGILMLMGIVTKNAIMLLDFAIEREAHGLPRMEAIIEACSERVRPIVMTTLAMTGGMLPSAFGIGDGGEFRSPMAIAVIGGLLVSTLLSLIVIPSLHLVMSNGSDRILHWFRPFTAEGGQDKAQ